VSTLANIAVALVALLHLCFLMLEMFYWDKPLGLRVFRRTPEDLLPRLRHRGRRIRRGDGELEDTLGPGASRRDRPRPGSLLRNEHLVTSILSPSIITEFRPMRTALIILGGFVLLGIMLLVGRWLGGDSGKSMVVAAQIFIPIWLAAAGLNMWVGVAKAGYSVAEELPIFLLIFALPAAAAAFAWWKFA
jgi:hypothetical protein